MRPRPLDRRAGVSTRCACAALVVLLSGSSALRAQPASTGAAPARTAAEPPPVDPATTLPDLEAVPQPVVDVFEPAVKRQLLEARATVEALVAGRRPEALEAFGTLCLLYLRYELLDAAEACLAQARALGRADFRWPYYQTYLYTRTGDLDRARSSVEAALGLRPDDRPALLRAGELALRAGEPERAGTAYAAALAADPGSSAARFGLGRVAAARGDPAAAAGHFEGALAGQPEGSVVHYHLGMAYRALGEVERAREEVGRSRQIAIAFPDPLLEGLAHLGESREAIFARGSELLRRDDPRAAVAAFERVLELDPADAQAHYNLARAAIELEGLEDAERHLRQALAAWPEFFDAHLNLAILLGRTGRPAEAAEHIEAAVAIDPEHLPSRLLLARILGERGEVARAIAELEAILQLDPSTTEARMLLVMTLLRDGDHARARREMESGLSRQPDSLALQDLLARHLATCPDPALRDGTRALALAERLIERQLTLEHVETLAMALAEVGRFDDAVLWQRRALERQASIGAPSPSSQRHLERYLERQPVREPWSGTAGASNRAQPPQPR